jgi:hypothetical protein
MCAGASAVRRNTRSCARFSGRAYVAEEGREDLIAAVLSVEEQKEDSKRNAARVWVSTHTSLL